MIEQTKAKMLAIQQDPLFTFDEESHSYHYGWERCEGATSWIAQNFQYPFDEDFYSKKVAAREGKTQEEVLAEWKDKADTSKHLGHTVHSFIENWLQNPDHPIPSGFPKATVMCMRFATWYAAKMKPKRLNLVEEIQLNLCPEIPLAGTADDPFWSKRLKGVVVNDWKTNEKFTTDQDYSYNMLKYPFHEYKDNKLNFYSIQISLYRLMLEYHGIPTVGGTITHIPHDGDPVIYAAHDFRPKLQKYLGISL